VSAPHPLTASIGCQPDQNRVPPCHRLGTTIGEPPRVTDPLDIIAAAVARIESKVDRIERRLDRIEERLERIERKQDRHEMRIEELETSK
jgi:hypothetical protein